MLGSSYIPIIPLLQGGGPPNTYLGSGSVLRAGAAEGRCVKAWTSRCGPPDRCGTEFGRGSLVGLGQFRVDFLSFFCIQG